MKILLVNPKIPYKFRMFDYADEEGRQAILKRVLIGPPLALNELAGMLPEEDIIILDQQSELNHDSNYNAEEDLVRVMKDFQPDIVGFTCITAQYNSLKKLFSLVKEENKKILTVVGGIHPTSCPEVFVDYDVDLVAMGIGKTTFYRVVQEFKKNGEVADYTSIPGLAIKKVNEFQFTKPLGELSFQEFRKEHIHDEVLPNRALTERYNYYFPTLKMKVHYLSTSLGCTNRCNFCFLWKMTDGRYYHREVETIIAELKQMDEYPLIRFCDANTFGNVERSRQLFTRIIEEGLDKNHIYFADVRTDTVIEHPDLFQLASLAGLKAVICGLEATSNKELQEYGKDNTIENIIEALKILNLAGMNVHGNYIIRPDYDEADFERVARFIEANPIYHSGFTILTPFPGTEQWELLKDQIVIKDYDYYNLTNAVIKTKLTEEKFYHNLSELYKLSSKATQKFHDIYGKVPLVLQK